MTFEPDASFPILVIYEDGNMVIWETLDQLTICSSGDVKAGEKGRFGPSKVFDSRGFRWQMSGATTLHGVGSFWGYNVCLNRTIRARPTMIGDAEPADLQAVRDEVLKRLRVRDSLTITVHAFCTTVGKKAALKLVSKIESARSIQEIIVGLLGADFPERARIEKRQPAAGHS